MDEGTLFYSDAGVLPPTRRSPANHRRYDLTAITRLELIRTLRDLGPAGNRE